MFVHALCAYADVIQDDMPPAYYKTKPVDYYLDIDTQGMLIGIFETPRNKKKGISLTIPVISRSRDISSSLFIDKPSYIFGADIEHQKVDGKKTAVVVQPSSDTKKRHEAYMSTLRACSLFAREFQESNSEQFVGHIQALIQFFEGGEYRKAIESFGSLETLITKDHLIVPRINGEYFLHQHHIAKTFWATEQDKKAEDKSKRTGECMILGEERKIVSTHPTTIPLGGNRTKLVSANENAFESYGLKSSEIAPMSQSAARIYGETLNFLLSKGQERHHLYVAGVTYAFWVRDGSDPNVVAALKEPSPEGVLRRKQTRRARRKKVSSSRALSQKAAKVATLLKSPSTASVRDLDAEAFYAVALTSNKSRLVVRDWIETSVGTIQDNLADWFERQELLDTKTGALGDPLSVFRLAVSTVRDSKDLAPRTMPTLIRCALFGHHLSLELLTRAQQRARVGTTLPNGRRDHVPYSLAVLLKMVLNDPFNQRKGDLPIMPGLNPQDNRPAYVCGRLFAVLERAQQAALGYGLNTTIADRFFGTASSAPASVFGRLMKGSQAHLQKLRKINPGAHTNIQRELEEILALIDTYPSTLTLVDQGLFSLGYYHQRGHATVQKNEAQASKDIDS